MKTKIYYLFLLIMFFLFNGCTSKTNTYPNKYEYNIKKDTVKRSRDWGYYNNRTYSTNSGVSNNSYSTNNYKSSKSYSKPKSYTYSKPKSSYKRKSYSSSRKSYSSRTRSRRR